MRSAGALLARPTPARPGPGPMAEGLLRALDISIGRRVEGLLAGDFRSNLLGTGTELAMIRPYVPGDDVRRIDWNVTARTGEPHVRVDLAERVLVTWLVLDTSVSMQFGTADRRKADVAEGVAVAIGHLATRRGNRLGVVTFGGTDDRAIPPRQGRVGLVGLLAALRSEPPADGPGSTSLADGDRPGRGARPPALARRRRVRLPRGSGVAPAAARSSRDTTTSSRSRSAILASRSCPTSVSSISSTPRRGDSFASTRGAGVSASGSRWPLRPSADQLTRALSSVGVRHVVLSTAGDWLRPLVTFLRRSRS